MKIDESVTTECFTCASCAAANSSMAAIESWAVVTVLASADLLTLMVRPGVPFVSDQPVVCTSASDTVATSLRKTANGWPAGDTPPPTMRFSRSAIEVKRPVADTGTRVVPTGSCPPG